MNKYLIYEKTIEFKVKSDMYNITDCVVDINRFKQGKKIFPCGSGEDYILNEKDIKAIKKLLKQE